LLPLFITVEQIEWLAYVAPARKTSIVLALVKADTVPRKMIVETAMNASLLEVLLKVLQTITGINSKPSIIDRSSARVIRAIRVPEKM
jgi:hypothetical protein